MEYYVYILRSKVAREKNYIGDTTNLENRLKRHLQPDPSAYTKRYAPWILETYLVFKNKELAHKLEVYFKSQSGRAFLRKRLIK